MPFFDGAAAGRDVDIKKILGIGWRDDKGGILIVQPREGSDILSDGRIG